MAAGSLLNGGFETWSLGLPDNWQKEGATTVKQDITNQRNGAACVNSTVPEWNTYIIWQEVSASQHEELTFSAYCYYGGSANPNLNILLIIEFRDSSNNFIDSNAQMASPSGSYSPMSVVFAATDANTDHARLCIFFDNAETTSYTFYVDDASLSFVVSEIDIPFLSVLFCGLILVGAIVLKTYIRKFKIE